MMLAAVLVAGIAVEAASAEVTLTPEVTTRADEWGPAAGSGGIAWNRYNRRDSWVLARVGTDTFRVNSPRTYAWTGSIEGTELVYQRANRRGSDIVTFDLASRSKMPSPDYVNTRWWEYYPTASGDWVFFARTNVNYGQRREWRRLVLVNTVTGKSRTLAKGPRRAELVPGQVSGDWAVWYECPESGCVVYRYQISTKTKALIPQGGPEQYEPAVSSDGTMYFLRSGSACGRNVTLVRRTLGGTESVLYAFAKGIDADGLYVYDGLSQDLYLDDVDCYNGNEGDIYKVSSADTAAPVISSASAVSEVGTPGHPRSDPLQMSRTEPSRSQG